MLFSFCNIRLGRKETKYTDDLCFHLFVIVLMMMEMMMMMWSTSLKV